ncbi:MAG TPA: hypothetical protein VFL04_02565, partial [Rectinemataceae bacterium]|nr:hypothetical protein [Rectinemataceae bacterium]
MIYLYVALFLFAPVCAHAYLDPGTGSLLLYALAGIATSLVLFLRGLWYSIRSRVLFRGAPAVSRSLPDIVFHSEGGKYWQVFQPVIAELDRRGIDCAYVTPDAGDPALTSRHGRLTAFRPGNEVVTIAHMNALKAPLVVSTTPHLDVYMLRRSKGVKHYAHLFHAPTDIPFYEKYAFDWYDSMLTVGPFQEPKLRALEAARSRPSKRLYETGCTY